MPARWIIGTSQHRERTAESRLWGASRHRVSLWDFQNRQPKQVANATFVLYFYDPTNQPQVTNVSVREESDGFLS
jgi:hypothetical protein